MKTYYAIVFCAVIMVGCQKGGGQMSFEDTTGQFSMSSNNDDYVGDLTPEDLEAIEEQENNQGDDTEVALPIDDVIPPGEDPEPVVCPQENNLVATTNECLRYIEDATGLLDLEDGSTIQNFNGNLKGRTGSIVALKNSNGNFVLVGVGNASIELIKDVSGNLLICNMTVGVINATSNGNIKIDGGNVCLVNGHKGNLYVNNGSIGEVKNGHGNVNVVNGDIGFIENQTGNVNVSNGSVDSVEKHGGNISIYDGNIVGTFNTRGNIKVENGNIGDVHTHTGNVRVKNGTITGTITNVTGNVKAD